MPPRSSTGAVRKVSEAKPIRIAAFSRRLELRKSRMQPAQVVRLDCRPGEAVMAKLHQRTGAVRFQREFHGRFAGFEACDPAPREYDLLVRNDLDIFSDDLHAAGL